MKPCPFCGSDRIDIITLSDQPGDAVAYACEDCGAVGPADLTDEGVQEKWNDRRVDDDNSIRVDVVDVERPDEDWPPEAAEAFLAWFASKLAMIPTEFLGDAIIEIDSKTDYDGHFPRISIKYWRPENDSEKKSRRAAARAESARIREDELRTLAELQVKYGEN